MSQLTRLLERAFENKNNQNRYSSKPWSIGFTERTWDTHFQLYYNETCVMEGNTLDKELTVTNTDYIDLPRFVQDVEKAMPDYHFSMKLLITMPVDFNEHWTQEVNNAEFLGVEEEVRPESLEDGYGYDVAAFSVPSLAAISKVVVTDLDRRNYQDFSICDYELFTKNGTVEIIPSVYQQIREHPPLSEQMNSAESRKQGSQKSSSQPEYAR